MRIQPGQGVDLPLRSEVAIHGVPSMNQLKTSLRSIAQLFLLGVILCKCEYSQTSGQLLVRSIYPGTFEIYSASQDSDIQFVSKQLGTYNQDIDLTPGRYLLLGDCSHRFINVTKNQKTELVSHTIEFLPPRQPDAKDIFAIQCSRFERTGSRQYLTNRFRLSILEGQREILVGMKPMKIPDLSKSEPSIQKYSLSTVAVLRSSLSEDVTYPPFFVSPVSDLLGVTQPQEFDSWVYLLPDAYYIYVNGTKQKVTLSERESRVVIPTLFKLETPDQLESLFSSKYEKKQFAYQINDAQELLFDRFYPLINHNVRIKFKDSTQEFIPPITPHQVNNVKVRGLLVDTGCAKHEWECLAKREIVMFNRLAPFPYIQAKADRPVLYVGKDLVVAIEGSKGLKLLLDDTKDVQTLRTGKLKISPKLVYKSGYITDLLRLEALRLPYLGYSNDIPPDRTTALTLAAGKYRLARYTSINETDRFVSSKTVKISPGRTTKVEIPFFVSDGSIARAKKKLARNLRNNLNDGETRARSSIN